MHLAGRDWLFYWTRMCAQLSGQTRRNKGWKEINKWRFITFIIEYLITSILTHPSWKKRRLDFLLISCIILTLFCKKFSTKYVSFFFVCCSVLMIKVRIYCTFELCEIARNVILNDIFMLFSSFCIVVLYIDYGRGLLRKSVRTLVGWPLFFPM